MHSDRRIAIFAALIALTALTAFYLTGSHSTFGGRHNTSDSLQAETPAGKENGGKTGGRNFRSSSADGIRYAQPEERQAETFVFDPNTADSTQLLRLGLSPWQVRSIYRYRAKGGIFRTKKDFARLYGLTVKEYRRLEPFIRISADYRPAASLFAGKTAGTAADSLPYPRKISEGQHVALNTADTTQLMTVPGIGSYYARRITAYRQRLGGFATVDQLDEIEGFPTEAKKFFIVSTASVSKLNLNSATLQQMHRHPYVSFQQARAIESFRRLHGRIDSLGQLRLAREFTERDLQRLRPYVTL